MPIYEFYCEKCNTIFNFLSKTPSIKKQPLCPKCRGRLQKQVSLFSAIKPGRDEDPASDMPVDESRFEKAITQLASEAEGLDGDNPRQAADLMRKFSDLTGIKLGDGMQEALNRMQKGEDPEKIEAELGDILEQEDPFKVDGSEGVRRSTKKKESPLKDDTLYEL